MSIPNTLRESLNGEFAGLYAEVVTHDTYRLQMVRFQPDIVIDIGGNVGIFARYARTLFPEARIYSLEPHFENCQVYRKFTKDLDTHLCPMALGKGQIYRGTTARNGSGETYLSSGLGYPKELMDKAASLDDAIVFSDVPCISLADFINTFWKPGMRSILKIDCEGAENCIWEDPPSMEIMRQMDYIAMEVHDYALTGSLLPEVKTITAQRLVSLERTHNCRRDGVHFWATKKK